MGTTDNKVIQRFRCSGHRKRHSVAVFDSSAKPSIKHEAKTVTWAIEFNPSDELVPRPSPVAAILGKCLHRGRSVLLEPEIETFITANKQNLQEAFKKLSLDCFNPESFEFDSPDEREVWREIATHREDTSRYCCPQVYLESFVKIFQGTEQHTDFLLNVDDKFRIVEHDGASHRDSAQTQTDHHRDESLYKENIQTIRITVKNPEDPGFFHETKRYAIENQKTAIQALLKEVKRPFPPHSPEHFAHVISVMICDALKRGLLKTTGSAWSLQLHLPSPDASVQSLARTTIKATMHTINMIEELCGLEPTGEPSVGFSPSGLNHKADVHFHFDSVPDAEVSAKHLFYHRSRSTART